MATAPAAASSLPDGLPTPRRHWSMVAVWLTITMAVLDGSVVNIAIPRVAKDFGADPAAAIWVINAYQLAITMLLLPMAALGERLGYFRVYATATVVFIAGSLACALSQGLTMLIVARMFQGIGAAGIMSLNAAMVRATVPAALLGRTIGYNALVLSASAAMGPTIAGVILHVAGWPWLFAVNLPIGLAALAVGIANLPRGSGHGQPFAWLSAAMSAAALGLLVFGGETLARHGSATGAAMFGCGIIVGMLLWLRERRAKAPLVPFDLLRIPIFALSIATSILSFAAQMLTLVAFPFLLQTAMGRSAVETGLLMTPWPVAAGVLALLAGRLADRYPAGLLGGFGLALFAIGLVGLATLDPGSSDRRVLGAMALCGAGFGLFQAPNNRTIVGTAPLARSGAAGGMLATARLLGQTFGAVAVAAGFTWIGLDGRSCKIMIACAALAAVLGAGVSLLRLQTGAGALSNRSGAR